MQTLLSKNTHQDLNGDDDDDDDADDADRVVIM